MGSDWCRFLYTYAAVCLMSLHSLYPDLCEWMVKMILCIVHALFILFLCVYLTKICSCTHHYLLLVPPYSMSQCVEHRKNN